VSARIPQPVVYTEGEMTLANALDLPTPQLRMIKRCPDCEAYIIPCDNNIWLDAKAQPRGVENHTDALVMGIIEMGGLMMAGGGDVQGGSKHRLHDHQPDEEDAE